MTRIIRSTLIAATLAAALALPAAQAVPLTPPELLPAPIQSPIPVNGLLCGRGWHWSYAYFKCERNRHRCPAGKHWISLFRTCVGL